MKHTPAPWNAVGAWVEHPDDSVADICTCNPADIDQEHLGRSDEEVRANAKLIAAAPDLLDALRIVFSTVVDAVADGGIRPDVLPVEIFRRARAAIAKAEAA